MLVTFLVVHEVRKLPEPSTPTPTPTSSSLIDQATANALGLQLGEPEFGWLGPDCKDIGVDIAHGPPVGYFYLYTKVSVHNITNHYQFFDIQLNAVRMAQFDHKILNLAPGQTYVVELESSNPYVYWKQNPPPSTAPMSLIVTWVGRSEESFELARFPINTPCSE